MSGSIKNIYEQKVSEHQKIVDETKRKLIANAVYRGISFLAIILGSYFLAKIHWGASIASVFIIGYLFVWLIQHSAHISQKLSFHRQMVSINKKEIKALAWKYDQFDNGEEFFNPEHYHQYDLDIFGEGSMYQYLNRTCTQGGKQAMAAYLSQPELDHNEIISRQLATVELAPLLDWRQKFQATGTIENEEANDKLKISEWMERDVFFMKKKMLGVFIYLVPILSLLMLALLILDYITGSMFILYLAVPFTIIGVYLKQINHEQKLVSRTWQVLRKYASLLEQIESADFRSKRLGMFQYELKNEKGSASGKVGQLSKIIKGLDNRNNMLVGIILDGLFLWDLHFMIKLEKWRTENKNNFERWIHILSEFDALSSFGNFAYNNPLYVYPDVEPNIIGIKANEIGHPLLASQQRVNNDFEITQNPAFIIITGANMAGKSTFLRTIGINMVLGMAGAPVCANRFSFAPTEVYTSMRTTDSLQKNESYFFAELSRLKIMIDKLKSGTKLFIILDEVLKGTNSKDKAMGSKALVKQLITMKTTGIIATHDVSLGTLINEFPENVRNNRFEVEMVNDELEFDYKLKEGISQNLNATFLMQKMGITIDESNG